MLRSSREFDWLFKVEHFIRQALPTGHRTHHHTAFDLNAIKFKLALIARCSSERECLAVQELLIAKRTQTYAPIRIVVTEVKQEVLFVPTFGGRAFVSDFRFIVTQINAECIIHSKAMIALFNLVRTR